MKRGKSSLAFSWFKSPANDECAADAQVTLASAVDSVIRPTENAAPPAEPLSSSKNPLSILKLFVNRIRPRTGTTETLHTDTLTTAAHERREAALQERGLLSPLKRNKDQSRRERERDPLVAIPSPGDVQPMTPANQIKKEWEAKKRIWEEEERERLNRFRFGTQSTSVNETQAHGQPSPPLGVLALSSHASTDEDAHAHTLGASGVSKPRSPVDDHSLPQVGYPTEHLPTFIPVPAPLHACSVTHLPQTSVVIQAGFEPGPPQCPAITSVPLETTPFQEDAASPGHQRSESCLASSVSEARTSESLATPSVDIPHTAGLPILSAPDTSLRLSGMKDVPTIVESPIEDGLPTEKAILNPIMETQQVQLQIGQYNKPRRRKRRTIFSEDQSGRRLTIATSLSSMRRSIAGTLMRTKSSMNLKGLGPKRDEVHDALSLESRTTQLTGLDALTAPRRRAVAPTLHSQGSILLQTSAIEDEEARRVAELAYLG